MHVVPPGTGLRFGSRREALRAILSAAAAAVIAPRVLNAAEVEPRSLSLLHTHTHERLSVAYFSNGSYAPEGLGALNHFLRDHRTGDSHPIDPQLFDILFDLRQALGTTAPFQVISGYRSPRTNSALRERSRGVAAGSLHLTGKAIDVRLPGVDCGALRDAAVRLRRGGVGYYASSDFVHLDTGRFRTW